MKKMWMKFKKSKIRRDFKNYYRLLQTYLKTYNWGCLIIIVMVIGLLALSVYLVKDNNRNSIFTSTSIGILFPFGIAIFTLGGFLISLSKLEELLGRITSLNQFLERSNALIEKSFIKNDDLLIVCHSPFIGNLSERGRKSQKRFRENINRLIDDKNHKIKIIGICPSALENYYKVFGEDPRYDRDMCKTAFREMRDFFVSVSRSNKIYNVSYFSLNYYSPFFLVASKYEAVVASPFFLPLPHGFNNGPDQNKSNATLKYCANWKSKVSDPQNIPEDKSELESVNKVELLGFVTRDSQQIHELMEAAEFLINSSCEVDENCDFTIFLK